MFCVCGNAGACVGASILPYGKRPQHLTNQPLPASPLHTHTHILTPPTKYPMHKHETQNMKQTADAQNIAAKYENGVLRVHVGKQAEAASRKAIRVE
jgi:hypothetical protein